MDDRRRRRTRVFIATSNQDPNLPSGQLVALDAATGNELWHYAPPGGTWLGSAAVANGIEYDPGLLGLDAHNAATGKLLWTTNLGCGNNTSSPAVVDGYVYIACNSTVYAYTID